MAVYDDVEEKSCQGLRTSFLSSLLSSRSGTNSTRGTERAKIQILTLLQNYGKMTREKMVMKKKMETKINTNIPAQLKASPVLSS